MYDLRHYGTFIPRHAASQKAEEDSRGASTVIEDSVRQTDQSLGQLKSQIGAVYAVHRAVGQYLSIDLTPGPETLRSVIRGAKELSEEL